MRLIENSNTKNIYNLLKEDFWNPCKYAEMIMNLDFDTSKWNEASQEERVAMVLPKLEEFWQEYGPEIKRKGMLRRILKDLTDSNFHTEAGLLRKIVAKDRRNSRKVVKESITDINDPEFEDTVKRDFRLFLMDKYGDELYSDVTNDDINEYFTGMFYDIWDNDDLEAANEAEKIIRNTYNCLDSRDFSDDYEYDDGDTNFAAEEEADATERMERRYGSVDESVDTNNLKDIYYFLVGICLDETRPEANEEDFFDFQDSGIPYKIMDENYGVTKTAEEALSYAKGYISDGVQGTFGLVIKAKEPFNGFAEDISGGFNDGLEFTDITNYKSNSGELIYCAYKDKDNNIQVISNVLDESLTESAKKSEKEDKRVVMQQGNVTCIKENESYFVFENESDNEVEHDSEESAMKDFLERCGVNPDNELKEE